ncbi:MAG: hypothetical protein ACOCTH_02830 [Halodesulfurarchaeum sp.]
MTNFEDAIRDRAGMSDPSPLDDETRRVFDDVAEMTRGKTFFPPRYIDVLESHGWDQIGTETDASRKVFRNGDLVMKLDPIGMDPWRNENEVLNWTERLPESAKAMFSPVLDYADDFGWLVMRYADTDSVTDQDHADLLHGLIVVHNLDMTDPHPNNVGLLDGVPVMIDYNFRPKEAAETPEARQEAYEIRVRNYTDTEP